MSFYETLKAAKIGAAPDVFTTLRAQKASFAKSGGSGIKELEDTPPLSFSANGEPLVDWNIKGASSGVGDKSANLFDKDNVTFNMWISGTGVVSSSGYACGYRINDVPDSVHFSYKVKPYSWSISGYANNQFIERFWSDTDELTVDCSDYDYIIVCIAASNDATTRPMTQVLLDSYEIMVNEGSTSEEYEPYGYKISVTCGGETNTIYLDAPLGASDSISMTDTGVSIPTVDGSNTLSVGTTVQPSSVYIKYKERGDEMVTLAKIGGKYNTPLLEIRGLSTDTKPTAKIEGMIVTNGSTYIEIDTGDTYMFDAENGVWHNITG